MFKRNEVHNLETNLFGLALQRCMIVQITLQPARTKVDKLLNERTFNNQDIE